ncbi:MAG: magnesium/cobalt transporter CorA [Candidatus Aenigmarchaeota archaeon]|nr:magnesium/cobalt transporter CorA [Candidatus Aenigmarchaeota archaeon]
MIEAFILDKDIKRTTSLKTNKRIWVDVTDPTKPDLEKLAQSFPLHHLTLEDCSKTGNRVKLEQFNEYLFIITYGLESSKKGPLAFQMNFVIGKNFLLTVHKEKISSFDSLKSDSRRLRNLLSRGPDLLMHHLMDMEIDFYFPVLDEIEDQIDDLEEEVYRNIDHKVLGRLFRLKRQLLTIRKRVGPQKEVVLLLTQKSFPFISEQASAYYRDIFDHIIRINESIDDYREILSNTLEVHISMVSNRMNEVMKALTIVATVMLPLTVLTGIYGMNLNIPESHIDFMYYIVLSLMVIIAAIMMLYFRRKRWI